MVASNSVSDIIAAVSTAPGEGGISVIRLSGEGSVGLTDQFFRAKRTLAESSARHLTLGSIVMQNECGAESVDQVLAVRFEAGASYTGEESAEIHCHGGFAASARCMELLLSAGARLALPGEFTKRAFLSGRIDLTQAEAVLSVVRASSDAALLAAGRSLQGELSARLRKLLTALTELRAEFEVRMDYPEDTDEPNMSGLSQRLSEVRKTAQETAERCRIGMTLKDGLRVAIVGRPNVGKSSLLNAITGESRAIVTDRPGTTRDTIEAATLHKGLLMRFTDTAGIRESSDEIERLGVARSVEAISGADICLVVLDSTLPLSDEERDIISGISEKQGKLLLIALNKRDLSNKAPLNLSKELSAAVAITETSALTGDGISELKDALFESALGGSPLDGSYAATARITEALLSAVRCMDEALHALEEEELPDAAGSLLAEAAMYLASPLGADASEELIDTVFSSFCVGK